MKTPWQIMTKGDWLVVLMLLGTLNFLTAYTLFQGRVI